MISWFSASLISILVQYFVLVSRIKYITNIIMLAGNENICLDAISVALMSTINIPPKIVDNRIYESQRLGFCV